jgi:hypothetical protein
MRLISVIVGLALCVATVTAGRGGGGYVGGFGGKGFGGYGFGGYGGGKGFGGQFVTVPLVGLGGYAPAPAPEPAPEPAPQQAQPQTIYVHQAKQQQPQQIFVQQAPAPQAIYVQQAQPQPIYVQAQPQQQMMWQAVEAAPAEAPAQAAPAPLANKNAPMLQNPQPISLPQQELAPQYVSYPVLQQHNKAETIQEHVTQQVTQPVLQRIIRQQQPIISTTLHRTHQPIVDRVVTPVVTTKTQEGSPLAPIQASPTKKGQAAASTN